MAKETPTPIQDNWQERFPLPESLGKDDFLSWLRTLDTQQINQVLEDLVRWQLKKNNLQESLLPRIINAQTTEEIVQLLVELENEA